MMALAATLATGSLVHASQIYGFSYSFLSGSVVSGSFTGTANGNLITGLSNISVSFDGVPFALSVEANPSDNKLYGQHHVVSAPFIAIESGGAVASFDGTANNLLFIDCDYSLSHPCFYTNYFASGDILSSGDLGVTDYFIVHTDAVGDYGEEGFDPTQSRWSVTVPEPGSLVLSAIALLGLAASRRKNQA